MDRLLSQLSTCSGDQTGVVRQKEKLEIKYREMEQVVASVQRRLNAEKVARNEVYMNTLLHCQISHSCVWDKIANMCVHI